MIAGLRCFLLSCAFVFPNLSGLAAGEDIERFYRGKTVSLIIASGEGGGYDIAARLVAEHLPRHIPGRPTIVPQNMPGASGVRAADYLFNVAPRDGSVLSVPQPSILFNKLADPAMRFEPEKYVWIGRLSGLKTYGIAWKGGVDTIEAMRAKEFTIAAAQGAGTGAIVSAALTQLAGLKLKVVKGYKSVSESALALERGEVQGISSASLEFLDSKGWVKDGPIRILYVVGMSRNTRLPDVPTIIELAANPEAVETMKIVAVSSEIGRSLVAPPGIGDRGKVLRDAFDRLIKDPVFLADAHRRNVEIEPASGRDLQQWVGAAMQASSLTIEKARRLFVQ
jgi:tripartite-type tricarboxylate transporter receptor subunit TctC